MTALPSTESPDVLTDVAVAESQSEREAAALDLADAAQAMARACAAERAGDREGAVAYVERGEDLYRSADRRRNLAGQGPTAPLHSAPLHSAPLHSAPLHSAPLHSAPLHSAPRY